MEKEGLVQAVNHLRKRKFKIEMLVTDRRKQIAKWARESLPLTKHCYDIWHLAKCMFDLLWYIIFQYPCIFPPLPLSPISHSLPHMPVLSCLSAAWKVTRPPQRGEQRPPSSLDTGEKSRGLSQMEYIQCQHPILNPAQEDVNSRLYGLYTDTCAESFRSAGT